MSKNKSPLSEEIIKMVAIGARLEEKGLHAQAEETYLKALSQIDPAEKEQRGILHINLGTNAWGAKRYDDAINYCLKAIELLRGFKGEAVLQSAHANWNIAYLYTAKSDPRAVEFAKETVRLFELYPFTPKPDLANARALRIDAEATFARAISKNRPSAETCRETWEIIKQVPYSKLYPDVVFNFLSFYLTLLYRTKPDEYFKMIPQLVTWYDLETLVKLKEGVESGWRKPEAKLPLWRRFLDSIFRIFKRNR